MGNFEGVYVKLFAWVVGVYYLFIGRDDSYFNLRIIVGLKLNPKSIIVREFFLFDCLWCIPELERKFEYPNHHCWMG